MRAGVVGLVLLTGCAVCHVPPRPPDLPADVQVAAFLDQGDCYTIDVRPEFLQVLTTVVGIVRMFLPASDTPPTP